MTSLITPPSCRGPYITFEGPEGCGKSTQMKMLGGILQEKGYPVLLTKEPGGTPVGVEIRKILVESKKPYLPKTESLLFWADRYEHHETIVKPALEKRMIVLGDRDFDSSWAYQHYGRGIPADWMQTAQDLAMADVWPDLTLLYVGDVDGFLKRVGRRKVIDSVAAAESRFDDEQLEFHLRVQNGFLERAAKEPNRFRILDANKSIRDLFADTCSTVQNYLDEHYQK